MTLISDDIFQFTEWSFSLPWGEEELSTFSGAIDPLEAGVDPFEEFVNPVQVGVHPEFVQLESLSTVTTSSVARLPSLQCSKGFTPRLSRVRRSCGGRKRSIVSYQWQKNIPFRRHQKDIILRHQRLGRLRTSNLDRGKNTAMALGRKMREERSKEIDKAASDVLLQNRLVVCDEKRPRSQNWSSDEKSAHLELKEEAVWTVEEPLGKEHVEDAVEDAIDSVFQLLGYRKMLGATTEEDNLMTRLYPLIKQIMHCAINKDAQMSMLAPFFKKHIENALERKLRPVASALQALGQKEQEDQQKLLAVEEQRRALDLEEMKIKRQRAGRHPRRISFSSKQQGLRDKKYTAEGLIPS